MMKDSPNAVNIPTNVGIATKSSATNAAANNSNLVSTTNSCSRLRWEPITIVHEDGTVLVHPFITSLENWMDIMMLLRALIVEQPFDAPYGKQGAA